MPTPGEHKTVQFRILEYAQAIGWTFATGKRLLHDDLHFEMGREMADRHPAAIARCRNSDETHPC